MYLNIVTFMSLTENVSGKWEPPKRREIYKVFAVLSYCPNEFDVNGLKCSKNLQLTKIYMRKREKG